MIKQTCTKEKYTKQRRLLGNEKQYKMQCYVINITETVYLQFNHLTRN